MDKQQTTVHLTDWTTLKPGLYRFHGLDTRHGGFWVDARLERRDEWSTKVEATNYAGDIDCLIHLINAFTENM